MFAEYEGHRGMAARVVCQHIAHSPPYPQIPPPPPGDCPVYADSMCPLACSLTDKHTVFLIACS